MNLDALDLSRLYTYSDYYKWKFKERVELIRGRVFKISPAPSRQHQKISLKLTGSFYNFFKESTCEVYPAPFDVRLPSRRSNSDAAETVVQPDLCVVCDLDKLDDRGCT